MSLGTFLDILIRLEASKRKFFVRTKVVFLPRVKATAFGQK